LGDLEGEAVNYPIRKTIAVDVDGTLIHGSSVNEPLIAWLRVRKEEGHELILWSARGREHARRAARVTETESLFDAIISKPGRIVDDLGWSWIKWTKIIHPSRISSL
jgi:hydroxymethylpyrimidine pyrophosphatase-like HAD family hydrolase